MYLIRFASTCLLCLLSIGCSAASAAQQCPKTQAATPQAVIQKWAQSAPAGKVACRMNGSEIIVPSISHQADGDDPPCGNDVVVLKSSLGEYKDEVSATGKLLTSSGNPYAMAAGGVIAIVVAINPTVAHNASSNCGIASITLPNRVKPFHYYASFWNDGDKPDPKKPIYPIDEDSFDHPGAGNSAFQKVTLMKPLPHKNGTTTYGILFKNWATDSFNYRHVMLVVDAFE